LNSLIVIYGPGLKKISDRMTSTGLEIYHVFDSKGLVDEELLLEYFNDICKGQIASLSQGRIGHFIDGTQVQRFCFLLCQKLGLGGVNILTVLEYNNVVSSCHKADDLPVSLSNAGEYIENVDASKKGFFDSLFNT
jgi:hypothetical protein